MAEKLQVLCGLSPTAVPTERARFLGGRGKAPAAAACLGMVRGGSSTLFAARGVTRLSGHEHGLLRLPHGQCPGSVSQVTASRRCSSAAHAPVQERSVLCHRTGAPWLPVCAGVCTAPQECLTVHGQGCSSHCCELFFSVFKIITGCCSFGRTKS